MADIAEQTSAATESGATQSTSTAASATTETNNSEATNVEATAANNGEEANDNQSNTSNDGDGAEDEAKKSRGFDARKEQLETEIAQGEKTLNSKNEQIRELVDRRNAIQEQIKLKTAEAYELKSVDDYMAEENPDTGEFYTRTEAEMKSFLDNQDMEKYTNQVAETQLALAQDAERTLSEFPFMDADNTEAYMPEVAKAVDSIIADNVQYDSKTNEITGYGVSPYAIAKAVNMALEKGRLLGKADGHKANAAMESNVDVTSGGAGESSAKPFEKMSLAEKREHLRKKGHDI